MLQLDLLNFDERNHDFLGSVALLDLQMEIVGGDAADALAYEFAARGFD